MKKLLVGALAFHLALLPCYADVVPTRHAGRDAAAQDKVKGRLQELGVAPAAADRQVQALTGDELSYFAAQPGRVQKAGALYWYEWVVGAVVFGTVLGISIWLSNEYQEQLE